jgi:hypothetical protein
VTLSTNKEDRDTMAWDDPRGLSEKKNPRALSGTISYVFLHSLSDNSGIFFSFRAMEGINDAWRQYQSRSQNQHPDLDPFPHLQWCANLSQLLSYVKVLPRLCKAFHQREQVCSLHERDPRDLCGHELQSNKLTFRVFLVCLLSSFINVIVIILGATIKGRRS